MKKLLMAALAGCVALGGAGAAVAQPGYGTDRHYDQGSQYDQGRHYDQDRHDDSDRYGHDGYGHDGYGHDGYGHDRYGHYRWNDHWRRGGRIDDDAWRHADRIDWRRHHLRAPPRGYEWRYVDGRYVMAAVASGIIADIILNAR